GADAEARTGTQAGCGQAGGCGRGRGGRVERLSRKGPTMKRRANAVWKGGLKDGRGTVSTETGALSNVPYTFRMRFENEKGSNPEELVAAAHAACFSMALSLFMANEGLTPESIETTCTLDFENVNGAWTVTASHLHTKVKSPNGDPVKFQKAADGAEKGCPISRLLNAKITMEATLI